MQTASPRRAPTGSIRRHERHHVDGRGLRIKQAFETLDTFPALGESRTRLLTALAGSRPSLPGAAVAIESDIALTCGVLRLANGPMHRPARADSVTAAVEALDPRAIVDFANAARSFDYFEHAGVWAGVPESMRLHALATQRAAARVASAINYSGRERLAATSLLHDIGKLVLARAYPGYPAAILRGARTPDERARLERRELGVDHAVIGGVLLARWGVPATLSGAIEHHHDPHADGEGAILRLADMLAHYERGAHVSSTEMLHAAAALELGQQDLRELIYTLHGAAAPRQRLGGDCPLTERELGLLRQLAEGSVYKQIAQQLGLSASTIRTHLHNIYGKLGVVNRAQAVLVASERGWL
ncbi:MAG TPA: HDOD domain-containing protein [Solirubrobacteraceae bacterium]|jgi:HD-like signal output (HDOD) protein|nr:HDOD domain-containing protein [Solirubrobacteraceae bacterium]